MNTNASGSQQLSGNSAPSPWHDVLTDAIHFWEPRRIPYNVILTVVVLAWLIGTWPHFRPVFLWSSAALLFILAALANLCYCAAYLADVPMQFSAFRSLWLRWRWGLWVLGMLLALAVANYWIADEIYPFIR